MPVDQLSVQDVSFLQIEDANSSAQLHIGSTSIFEGPAPAADELTSLLLDRVGRVPRCRQRLGHPPLGLGRPIWVEAADFQITEHVQVAVVAEPGGDEQLRELVGRIMSDRLDRSRPLWGIWFVAGLTDDRWALVTKVHHCMVDGVSGAELMAMLLDISRDVAVSEHSGSLAVDVAAGGQSSDIWAAITTGARKQLSATADSLAHPVSALEQAGRALRGMRSLALASMPRGHTSLTGPTGPHRVVAWTETSLADVKAIRAAFGGTINDVVLAAVTRGFRDLLLARGETVEGRSVRTLIPVSVRRPHDSGPATGDGTFDNKVSAMVARLPMDLADPIERHRSIRDQLAGLKESGQSLGGVALGTLGAATPTEALALGTRLLAIDLGMTTLETVTTNVPGSPIPLFSLGRLMTHMIPYVPVSSPVRIAVACLSYDGALAFSVTGDRDTSPDVDVVAAGIAAGIAELLGAAHAP